MESISTITSVIPHTNKGYSQEQVIPAVEIALEEKQSNKLLRNKYLQSDEIEISEASLKNYLNQSKNIKKN